MHIYCPFISPVTALPVAYLRQSSRSVASGRMVFQDWTGIDVWSFNGNGWWVLWLAELTLRLLRSAAVQELMDWRGWGRLLKRQQLAIKEQKSPFKCVLIHLCTLGRQRCQTYWRSCVWMTVINVSQQPLGVWFYLKHHKLLAQIFVEWVARMRLKPMRISAL